MVESKPRPSVTISSYTTLKRLEWQQKQAAAGARQESATKSELSTDFFKVSLGPDCASASSSGGAAASQSKQRGRQPADRARILIDLSQIRGPTGSVRGHKNVVRRSLDGIKMAYSRRQGSTAAGGAECRPKGPLSSFGAASGQPKWPASSLLSSLSADFYWHEYLERLVEDEQNLCVAYTTTLGVIRRTFEDSKITRSILNLNLIKFEERDIYLNQEYKFQLKIRLGSISVPALFVDGQHIGGLAELEMMNENGELQRLFAKFKMSKASINVCSCCGNARFIACPSCNGSRKSTIHHFKFNSVALRCIRCDKNDGLVMCPTCCGDGGGDDEDNDDDVTSSHDKCLLDAAPLQELRDGCNQTTLMDENNNGAPATDAPKKLLDLENIGSGNQSGASSKC